MRRMASCGRYLAEEHPGLPDEPANLEKKPAASIPEQMSLRVTRRRDMK